MFDYLRNLIFESVLWSYVFLGVNAQLIESAFFLLHRLLSDIFTFDKI